MADLAMPTEIKTYDLSQALLAIAYRPVTGDLLGFAVTGSAKLTQVAT